MGRIYVTGDIHSEPDRFNTENFPEQKEMTRDDYVIICGDFESGKVFMIPVHEKGGVCFVFQPVEPPGLSLTFPILRPYQPKITADNNIIIPGHFFLR